MPLAADLNTTRLRARQSKEERDRNARPILKTNAAAQVFRAAPFTGCRSWEDPLVPGYAIFHRALNFVPLMLYYMRFIFIKMQGFFESRRYSSRMSGC